MIDLPIKINSITFGFSHKTCFEDFSAIIYPGTKIGIIGRNGSGKSSLLKILYGLIQDYDGNIEMPQDAVISYVPQTIEAFDSFSGGQRFNKSLTDALSTNPDILLLDEPTNHLDSSNRKSLMRLLRSYDGILIVATHDTEFLRNNIDVLWNIDNEKVDVFIGMYDDYMRERGIERSSIEKEISNLNKQTKEVHASLMREQKRAKSSTTKGEKSIKQKKWPTIVSNAKAGRAQETSGQKKLSIRNKREDLYDQLSNVRLPETIVPRFSISSSDIRSGAILSIRDGSFGYSVNILTDIIFSLGSTERVAISGDNGSGKTTLIKALLNDSLVQKSGDWHLPHSKDTGYLDQHYNTLVPEETVLESIEKIVPELDHAEIRKHLNDFLFRKNEEVWTLVKDLSGGEKARLSLAQIAVQTPRLLILDEITNNLDIETKNHVVDVLKEYPGAIIAISHDEEFLESIDINTRYIIKNSTLTKDI